MKISRSLAFLLALSLVLNLAFLSAVVYKRVRRVPFARRAAVEIKNDFQLSAEQGKRVHDIIHNFKIASLLAKEEIRDKRVEIIEELGHPACDAKTVNSLTGELNQLENQLNQDFIATLLQINEILEPGQRLNLLYRLSRNWFFLTPYREKGEADE
jgi:Spy/CpxP family protein refolding chaperone